jgi:hypothetical protein
LIINRIKAIQQESTTMLTIKRRKIATKLTHSKSIATIFRVEKHQSDVFVFVTVNNEKASKVKFLDTEAFKRSLLFN